MIINRPFYLMRHAQTIANNQEIACGLLDSPLTQDGIEQIRRFAESLIVCMEEITTIYHSALIRSRKTAEHINEKYFKEISEHSDLNEHSFGEWEGLPWKYVVKQLKEGKKPPGGESRHQFAKRAKSALNNILNYHPVDSIPFIVAHGGTFFSLGYLFGLEIINIPNCHLCYFEPVDDPESIMPWKTSFFDYNEKKFIHTTLYFSE